MAKQTKELVDETKTGLQGLEQQLESAIATRDQYNRDLRNARARLKRKENSTYPDKLALQYIKDVKAGNVLSTTLIKWIDDAVTTNQEFAEEAYTKPLYQVAQDPDIYLLTIKNAGWAVEVDLNIIFEQEAGTLADWGQAVTDYREFELRTRGLDDEDAGERATDWWLTHVYGTALGDKTIEGRLNYTPTIAPYWQILNYGSSPLLSDRPGGHNPVKSVSTLFVEDAEMEIEDGFRSIRIQEYEVWQKEEQELRDVVREFEEKRDAYSEDVKNLSTEFRLNEKIYRGFADRQEFINQNKMIDIVRRLRAGEEFEQTRINIGTKGKRIYLNIKKVEGSIELEYG